MAKAAPNFFIESKAGIEIAQSAISIQLFKSSTSPLARRVIIKKMLIIIQKAITNIADCLLIVVCNSGFPQSEETGITIYLLLHSNAAK
jgi:hypothetical protein